MTITAKDNISLLNLVMETFPQISTTKAKKLILYGCISKKGAIIKSPEIIIRKGEQLDYKKYVGSARITREKTFIPVLIDDEDFIAVLKASGHRVDALPNEKDKSVFALTKNYLRRKWGRNTNIFIIDSMLTGEGGICLFAKNKHMQINMQNNLSKNTKEYHVIVEGKPKFKNQKLNMWISKDEKNKLNLENKDENGAVKCVLEYKTIKEFEYGTHLLVKVNDISSLYICFMLSKMGNAIIGDRRFGNKDKRIDKIFMFMTKLSFFNPVSNKRMTIEASLPQTFEMYS